MSLTDCINLILFALIQYNKTPVKPPFYRHFTGFLQFYGRSVKQLEFKDVLEIIDDKPRKIVVFVTNVSLTVHNYYFSLVLFSVDFFPDYFFTILIWIASIPFRNPTDPLAKPAATQPVQPMVWM